MSFSQRAKELRELSGLSQMKLSEKIGISAAAIGFLENQNNEPKGSTISAYAKFFNVSADYLLGLEDDFGTPTALMMHESATLSEKEKALLEAFKKLLPETQDFILRTAQSFSQKESNLI